MLTPHGGAAQATPQHQAEQYQAEQYQAEQQQATERRPPAPCAPRSGRPEARLGVGFEPIGLVVGVVSAAVAYTGLRHHAPLLLLAGAAGVIALLASFFLRPPVQRLAVGVTGPPRVAVGEQAGFEVTVAAPPGRSMPPFVLRLGSTHLARPGPVTWVGGLARGAQVTVTIPLVASQRTVVDHTHLVLTTTAPFGMVRRRLVVSLPIRVAVHPAYRLPSGLRTGGPDGDGRSALPDRLGTGVHGVREYRPGDPARVVAWRATARRGRLVVVDHERLPEAALALLLSGPVLEDDAETWEAALAEAAWAAVARLQDGGAVLLRRLTPAGPVDLAPTGRDEILDWFAGVDRLVPAGPDDEQAFRRVVAGALRAAPATVDHRHLTGTGAWR